MNWGSARDGRSALLASTLLLSGAALLAGTGSPPALAADPAFQLTQGSRGSVGIAQGFSGPGVPRGGPNSIQGGRLGGSPSIQGGVFSSNSSGVVAPGRALRIAAFCTDLLSEPPNSGTRFTGGTKARVTLADGRAVTLANALDTGVLLLRGRNESLNPLRPGGLALSLELVNTSPVPVRIDIPAGETVTPAGQSAQPLPPQAEQLFALATEERLTQSNALQYAVWAARGSTAEDVEQANLTRLSAQDRRRVQDLLDASDIQRQFDRERGTSETRYRAAAEALAPSAEPVTGTAQLPSGSTVEVEGLRDPEGTGLLTVRKEGTAYFYRADFRKRKDGKLDVTLRHLVTGRRIHPYRGYLLVKMQPHHLAS